MRLTKRKLVTQNYLTGARKVKHKYSSFTGQLVSGECLVCGLPVGGMEAKGAGPEGGHEDPDTDPNSSVRREGLKIRLL